jgi:hypothetical protein
MPRRGKLARIVDDFVATAELHATTVAPEAVTEQLNARIDAIADQVGVTAQTVLNTYIDEDWGRKLALQMINELADRQRVLAATPEEHLALPVAGRLIAALGQATLYAATNRNAARKVPAMDLQQAAEAITGLGLAIAECPPGQNLVPVPAEIVMSSRTTLHSLRDHLRAGDWTFCPCGDSHGQDETDDAVLNAAEADLRLLPPDTASCVTSATPEAATEPAHPSKHTRSRPPA